MANDCKPRVKPSTCSERIPEAPGGECCPDDNVERGWYNSEVTLNCPDGGVGSYTVPYATFHSTVSQEDADVIAEEFAETRLSCVWGNSEITVDCQGGSLGSITVPEGTFTSAVSKEDANQLAQLYAEDNLICVAPPGDASLSYASRSYTATINGIPENPGYESSPPKKYLRCESTGEVFYYSNGNGPVNIISSSGATTYDPVTGARLTQQAVLSHGAFWQYLDRVWYANLGSDGSVDGAFIENATELYWTLRPGISPANNPQGRNFPKPCDKSLDTGITEWQYSAWYENTYNSRLIDRLLDEDTEESALDRTAYTSGTISTASHSLRGPGEFTFTAVRVFVTANATSLLAGFDYRISYVRTLVETSTGAISTDSHYVDFTSSGIAQAVDLGEIACPAGYTATVSLVSVLPI